MLISAVNALICNMDLIAWNDSRCVLPSVLPNILLLFYSINIPYSMCSPKYSTQDAHLLDYSKSQCLTHSLSLFTFLMNDRKAPTFMSSRSTRLMLK